ncbi:uncharacterized protein LOC110724991 isoform X2 [Chenopodium quinoa]|uniref:uncharacterized protein LOC110724991 isoform X2 n=1 Tax=Chenopodium quinoa TaxID=63459 RepID=UPI000B7746AC|nr:uncharacterized protein LOC110724991 isoform X2 [Chenopodium quinoa]
MKNEYFSVGPGQPPVLPWLRDGAPRAPVQYQQQCHQSRQSGPLDTSYSSHLVRGPFLHPSHAHMSSVSIPATARGVTLNSHPHTKAGSFSYTAPENSAPKDPIDKGTDDTFVTLRDRKPQYGDFLKSLPKPLPLPLPLPLPRPLYESSSPKRKDRDDETEADEVEKSVEMSSAEELLTRHVKRAKRVRARLREERSQRIDRYKSRLALLLPPNGNLQE